MIWGWTRQPIKWSASMLILLGWAAAASADIPDSRTWGLPFSVADGLAQAGLASRPGHGGADCEDRLRVIYGYRTEAPASRGSLQIEELELIAAALDELPSGLVSRLPSKSRKLVFDPHLDRYASEAKPFEGATVTAVSGPGRIGIRVGAGWRRLPPPAKRATIVHEVAHELARELEHRKNWHVNWERAIRKDEKLATMRGRSTAFLSRYATTSASEDFAESVVAYVYLRNILRERAPHRLHLLELAFRPVSAGISPAARQLHEVRLKKAASKQAG